MLDEADRARYEVKESGRNNHGLGASAATAAQEPAGLSRPSEPLRRL